MPMTANLSLQNCRLCPRRCGVDRTAGGTGVCGAGADVRVAKVMLHHWEEPCISGADPDRGSGAVFFAHCSLGCIFCQNRTISRRDSDRGQTLSIPALAEIFLDLQKQGAWNINLVSPTHYTPQIIEAAAIAKEKGLSLPIVWNTGGYECAEVIEALRGTVDIFLTDWKYADPELAVSYSRAADYPERITESYAAMYDVAGGLRFGEDGMLKGGVILRHLLLPGCRKDSMAVLDRAASIVPPGEVLLSLMRQYTPEFLPEDAPRGLKRRITSFEYDSVTDHASSLGYTGYTQEAEAASAAYTPDF
ncbi:MAG: radical SAM protein [Ruminococcaceae bacterium]|nr:radical SAM protein [Oscillospiraceae bacterium]